jgi:hypothetical protein
MWKNIVEPNSPQMKIWRMHIACWIPKATNTNSGYVTHISFPQQQWLHERTSISCYRHITCIVIHVLGKTGPHFKSAVIQTRGDISMWSIGELMYSREYTKILGVPIFLAQIPKCPVWYRKPAFITKTSKLRYCDLW